jgi:hypothetical protein
MSFYEFIKLRSSWEEYLLKEENKEFPDKRAIKQINKILTEDIYLTFDQDYLNRFPLPKRKELKNYNTSKTRTVYVYPGRYRLILKVMSMYLLKNYNHVFANNSIAYTEGKSVKSAFNLLRSFRLKETDRVFKNDFSDYFNSIPLDLLSIKLKDFLKDDLDLCELIMSLLEEERVKVNNKVVIDNHKGVMAGSPIAGILANIYMHEVDMLMYEKKYKYIRYADDTLIVGKEALDFFIKEIEKLGIKLNPKKMKEFNLKTGFKYVGRTIDISDKALQKMKSRFKRRAKWYIQWAKRKHVKKDVALKDYIKKINYKLYSDQDDSINWSRWYLPNINTIESLKYLDQYFVSCIRYLDSETWTKGKKFYRLSYDKIKELGYQSLVNEYYKIKKGKA